MNSTSPFTWEDAKKIADLAVFQKFGDHLNDAEREVLQGSWDGLTYEKIAERYYRSVTYLRGDVGPVLWHRLSDALAEEVNKKNFKGALERCASLYQPILMDESEIESSFPSLANLSFPEGAVDLDSPLYLERDGIESLCYQTITKPGSLVRIKAPRLMGKTSLMARVLAHAQAQNHQTSYLDLSTVQRDIIGNLDKFLPWLCLMVGRQLQLENRLKDYWDTEILGSNDNCTVYFEEYLLPAIDGPLVLGLDNTDRIFPHAEVAEDVLGMLRSWHEKGKVSPQWKQLRLVMAHSTECYIPLDINQSPFNAGVPVELQEFDPKQVMQLVKLYGLQWSEPQIQSLMTMVGGHPYLVGLALYEIGSGKMTLEQLLQAASTEAGIFSSHLRRHLEVLQRVSTLAQAFKTVVSAAEPVALDSMQIYKLHSMGLVRQKNNQVMPRCQLYREYFHRVLSDD